ncbi:hypothetical protein JIN78_16650, partial [Roseibacillus ishigakijimensis]
MAKPLYDVLNTRSPQWVRDELAHYGVPSYLASSGLNANWRYLANGYYPWNPTDTLTAMNEAPATLGQVKAVYALRFEGLSGLPPGPDADLDGLSDSLENYLGT